MTPEPMIPQMVFTLWQLTVLLGLLVFVPLSVYSLHSLYRAVNSVRAYSRESLAAARGIQAHTAAVTATHETVGVATELLAAAESVAAKLDAIATVLEARTGRGA
jgi:beta-lactamase regulating signal transducer with metallopeptidase domain